MKSWNSVQSAMKTVEGTVWGKCRDCFLSISLQDDQTVTGGKFKKSYGTGFCNASQKHSLGIDLSHYTGWLVSKSFLFWFHNQK